MELSAGDWLFDNISCVENYTTLFLSVKSNNNSKITLWKRQNEETYELVTMSHTNPHNQTFLQYNLTTSFEEPILGITNNESSVFVCISVEDGETCVSMPCLGASLIFPLPTATLGIISLCVIYSN